MKKAKKTKKKNQKKKDKMETDLSVDPVDTTTASKEEIETTKRIAKKKKRERTYDKNKLKDSSVTNKKSSKKEKKKKKRTRIEAAASQEEDVPTKACKAGLSVESTEEDCTQQEASGVQKPPQSEQRNVVESEENEQNGNKPFGRSFRRVADEDWLDKKGAWNNSYKANFGSTGWGAKAQAVLGQVRGKNFRHEKTKKKRGTYMGGKISAHAVNSIKFDSDDE